MKKLGDEDEVIERSEKKYFSDKEYYCIFYYI